MRVVAVIPARLGSRRLPRKPLLDETGWPLIRHVHERVAACGLFAQVVVATDAREIAAAVRAFGGEARMTDPAHRSGTDRVAEVARGLDCELVVNVQGDEPEIAASTLGALVERMGREPAGVSMGTCAVALEDEEALRSPDVVKVVVDAAGYALYFSRAPIPHPGDRTAPVRKHVGVYAYRPDYLQAFARAEPSALERAERLEQLRALEGGQRIAVCDVETDSAGIDTPEEYRRFVVRWKARERD